MKSKASNDNNNNNNKSATTATRQRPPRIQSTRQERQRKLSFIKEKVKLKSTGSQQQRIQSSRNSKKIDLKKKN